MSHVYTAATVFAAVRRGATAAPVSPEAEADLITAAQAGDEQAVYTLITLYAPAARNALARYGATLDPEDAEMEVMVAFLDLIKSHETSVSPRLAGRIVQTFRERLTEATAESTTGFSIPARTHKRFIAVMEEAGEDVEVALTLLAKHELSREAFIAIYRALRATSSIEALNEARDDEGGHGADGGVLLTATEQRPYVEVEDRLAVEALLMLLDERETQIIRYAYGFDDLPLGEAEDPKEGLAKTREEGIAVANDTVVARAMGLSRATVQRTRAKALDTMRPAAQTLALG